MLDQSKQEQQSGDESVNLQAGRDIYYSGISYTEASEIALTVFNSNFQKMVSAASEVATDRVKAFTVEYLKQLQQVDGSLFGNLKRPDIQSSLFDAQKEYAKMGDNDLGALLVKMLVSRTAAAQRSPDQIYYDEALKAAPRLTQQQIDALTLSFITSHCVPEKFDSLDDFKTFFDSKLAPFLTTFSSVEVSAEDGWAHFVEYPSALGCSIVPSPKTNGIFWFLQLKLDGIMITPIDEHGIRGVILAGIEDIIEPHWLDKQKKQFKYNSIPKSTEKKNSHIQGQVNHHMRTLAGDLIKLYKDYSAIVPGIEHLLNLKDVKHSSKITAIGEKIVLANFKTRTGNDLIVVKKETE